LTLRLFDDLPELLKRVHTKPLFVMRVDVRQLQVGATPPVRKRVGLLQRINVKRDQDGRNEAITAMAEDEHKLAAGYLHFLGLCCRAALFNEGM
jgi:hypothetical protein